MKFIENLFKKSPLIIILIATALILTFYLDKPFIGHHDFNAVFYGKMAQNYLRFGFLKTKFGQATSVLIGKPEKFTFHTHHPPLLPILMAVSFKLLGLTEAAGRIVPIFFSLLGVYFFYQLGASFFSKQIAFFSSLFLILTPMFIYYGKLPVHEPPVLGLSLFVIYFYFLWIKSKENKYFYLLIPGLILAELTGWPAYYLPVIFFIHSLIFVRKRQVVTKTTILCLLSILTFSLLLYQNYILTGDFLGGGLVKAFLFRLNLGQRAATYPFTLGQFFKKEILWSSIFFTKTLIFLSLFWVGTTAFAILKSKKTSFNQSITFALLAYGFIHPLIFRNAAFLHDYMLYYLLPFLALSGASGLQSIIGFVSKLFNSQVIKNFSAIVFLTVSLIIATEKLRFVDALQRSNSHLQGYLLGKIIKKETSSEEKILTVSKKLKDYEDVFINFYSDNPKISFTENLDPDSLKEFDWLVFPRNTPEISQAELKSLQKNPSVEKQGFLFFKLK